MGLQLKDKVIYLQRGIRALPIFMGKSLLCGCKQADG